MSVGKNNQRDKTLESTQCLVERGAFAGRVTVDCCLFVRNVSKPSVKFHNVLRPEDLLSCHTKLRGWQD